MTRTASTPNCSRQVGRAQRLVQEKPDSAVAVLRQMLQPAREDAR
jgi:flagellar M-ring protein FliF